MTKKLMEINSYENGDSMWRVACDCSRSDHDVVLWFEADRDIQVVTLNLSMEVGVYPKWREGLGAWFEDKVERVKFAAKVLFTGYATVQGDVVLDADGVKAMQEALEKGLAHAKG
jgi:hypothetical protein